MKDPANSITKPDFAGMQSFAMIEETIKYLRAVGVSRKHCRQCHDLLHSVPHGQLEAHCQRWCENAGPLAAGKVTLKRASWRRRFQIRRKK